MATGATGATGTSSPWWDPFGSPTSTPAPTSTAPAGPVGSSDPVPDVPPSTTGPAPPGTTTVTTTPALFGLFGGSASTTTIAATPETANAAVSATQASAPTPTPPSTPSTTSVVIGEVASTFRWVLGSAIAACALYLVTQRTGIAIPVWILLLFSFVPYMTWISVILLIFTTMFGGMVDVNSLRGRTLSEVFGIHATVAKPI
jgi:hypothetical protein